MPVSVVDVIIKILKVSGMSINENLIETYNVKCDMIIVSRSRCHNMSRIHTGYNQNMSRDIHHTETLMTFFEENFT